MSCNHDCSSCGQKCRKADFLEKPHELTKVKKIIGIVSGKGGVGKSLVTSMMAVLAQRNGLKVAVLDGDVTGPSIPKVFGLTEKAMGTEQGILPGNTVSVVGRGGHASKKDFADFLVEALKTAQPPAPYRRDGKLPGKVK